MYEYIQGKLIEVNKNYIVLDYNGIGYRISISEKYGLLLDKAVNTIILLFIEFVIKENSQVFYGFESKEEKNLFCVLNTCSGVGPKMALAIMNVFSVSELRSVVSSGETNFLNRVPGIGKKTAEKIMLELKNKLPEETNALEEKACVYFRKFSIEDAQQTLMNIGYGKTLAEKMILEALKELPESSELPDLIANVLKKRN